MRRFIVTVVVSQLTGCAWLFQDKLPNGYEGYRGRSAPQCDTGSGWAILDGVFAASNGIFTLAVAADDTIPDRGTYLVSGVVWTLIHTASAISGSNAATDCRRAHAAWDSNATEHDDARERARLERQLVPPPPPPPAPRRPIATPPTPRGFYCTSSPTAVAAGLCTRIKADCTRARGVAIAAVPDLGDCTLTETAHCFDAGSGDELERCAPTEDACSAQQAAVTNAGACAAQW